MKKPLLLIKLYLMALLSFVVFVRYHIMRWIDHQFIVAKMRVKLTWLVGFILLLGGFFYGFASNAVIPSDLWGDYSHTDTIAWSLAYNFLDPGYQHDIAPHVRWFGLLVAILGVIMVSFLTGVLSSWIEQRADEYKKGLTRYHFHNHVVILGANDMVAALIQRIREEETNSASGSLIVRWWNSLKEYVGFYYSDIVVMTSTDTDKIESLREQLLSSLPQRHRVNIEVLYGDRSSRESLREIHIANAERIYLLGENNEQDSVDSYHDALNMVSLKQIALLLKESGRVERVPCHVMFEYQTTFSVFQAADISEDIKAHIEFLPFNFYEMHAQKALIGRAKTLSDGENCNSLEGCHGIDYESDKHVHLVIAGMSRMGIAMAIEAAHLAHYPNFVRDPKRCRTRITFIDKHADEEINFFKGRFKSMFDVVRWRYVDAANKQAAEPLYGEYSAEDKTWHDPLHTEGTPYYGGHLGEDFIDVDWEFINGNLESPVVQRYLIDAAEDPTSITTFAICFMQSNQAVAGAMYLPQEVYNNAKRVGDGSQPKVNRVLVFQRHNSAIIDTISQSKKAKYRDIVSPFGCKSDLYDAVFGDFVELGKRVNYVYSVPYNNDHKPFDHLPENDKEMADMNLWWSDLEVAKKWSSIYNANSIYTKLRSVHFDESLLAGDMDSAADNAIHYIAQTEHHRWNMEKLLMGFRPMSATEQSTGVKGDSSAHKDICSYDVLKKVDGGVVIHDYVLSSNILNIIQHVSQAKKRE